MDLIWLAFYDAFDSCCAFLVHFVISVWLIVY